MPIHLKLNDELQQGETHITLMGIEIDKFLHWKTEVKSVLPRLGKKCFIIRKMSIETI
jgi:hypothetical protein